MSHVATFSLFVTSRLLRPFRLDLKRIDRKVDWLGPGEVDPITYEYFANLRHVPTVSVNVADAHFGILGFPFNRASPNPFVLAFEKSVNSDGRPMRSIEAVLSSFYNEVQPRTALEVLDLAGQEAPGLQGVPASHWIAPWGTETVEQRAWRMRMWSIKDGLAGGKLLSTKDGLTSFGPVSSRKLALEVKRIARLTESIRANGFVTSGSGAPEVFGLRAGGEYRWFVIRGQHRFAACAALGITAVKARVIKIVRREDVAVWPHVAGGTFKASGALKLFDRLFAGKVSSCALPWVERNERHPART